MSKQTNQITHKNILQLINTKASEMNPDAQYCCSFVSTVIKQLNRFIAGRINLSEERIECLLDNLIGFYTITLPIPTKKGNKILRAVKFNDINRRPCFAKVDRLSYIPLNSTIIPNVGRLNLRGKSMYYGCIYFNDNWGGLNVAFSEINAIKHEHVNILKSEIKTDLNLHYIGIFDYVRRGIKPYFLPNTIYSYFEQIYEYEKSNFEDYVFIAYQLCDAFFSDILRRKESDKLFTVTSILGTIFLKNSDIDGILYTSVRAEDSPVVAIKPSSIEQKITHHKAISFKIVEHYGYAFYEAHPIFEGKIIGENIEWVAC